MSKGRGDFDPEIDLLRRYEQMIQTQIETLNGIDDKAAYIARLVAILVGLILSGVSVFVGTGRFSVSGENLVVFLLIAFASLSLFISLLYAIVTYLSSVFEYGPSPNMGEYMADYKVPEQEYIDVLLRGYSHSIKLNRTVVIRNSRRFERCLASLLAGLIFLFGAGTIFVAPAPLLLEIFSGIGFLLAAYLAVDYIMEEEFLTLDRESPNDE